MKRITVIAAIMWVYASAAWAEPHDTMMRHLPVGGTVTLSGMVDQVESDHAFMLRNDKGTIQVKALSNTLAFKQGDSVIVTGTIKKPLWGLLGNELEATSIDRGYINPATHSASPTKGG